jgi:NADH dehydrogenase
MSDIYERLLTFVVAGGGFAGVETLAAVNDFVREGLRFYTHIDPNQVRMVLVHSGALILPELGEHLGAYAQRQLAARGVEIVTNTKVSAVTPGGVLRATGVVRVGWSCGRTAPHPLLCRCRAHNATSGSGRHLPCQMSAPGAR